jgi:hypothetical protein
LCISYPLVVVWRGDLTTTTGRGHSAPPQCFYEPQQRPQPDQAELRIAREPLALARPVGVGPAPRELHRGAIGKPNDQSGLARRQDLDLATPQGMVAAGDGDNAGNI